MSALDQIVNINITQATASVPTVSTTIPLILGTTEPGWEDGDFVHAYSDAADLLEDGFQTSSVEYLAALSLTAQTSAKPSEFLVGRRSGNTEAGAVQRDKFTLTLEPNHVYQVTIDGTLYSYTSTADDNLASVSTGLYHGIKDNSPTAVNVFINSNNPGVIFVEGVAEGHTLTYTNIDSAIAISNTQAASLPQAEALTTDDLNAIQGQNDAWYGLVLEGASDADIQVAASWLQSQRKRLFANTVTTDLEVASDTSSIAAKLREGGYSRAVVQHCVAGAAACPASAWVGGQLPLTPGSNNWAFNALAGIAPDKWTASQRLAMIGNPQAGTKGANVNTYSTVGGVKLTQMGTNMDGSYIDDGIGIDWLFFNIQSSVFNVLVNSPKVPYTDSGVAMLIAAVHNVLDIAVANGLLNPGFKVTAPKVATVPETQRKNRVSPTITFNCVLSGAINAIGINGTVSV